MKKPPHSLRPFATIAAGLLALVSCQNATDSNTNSDSPVVATASFPIAVPRVPDNATSFIQNDTVTNKLNCLPLGSDTSTTCTATLNIPHPLGTDSLALQLWTLGVQTYTLYFKESGGATKLDYSSHSVVTLDTLLLSGFANLPAAQKSAFGTGPTGLVAYYASLLLANDAAVVGKALPVGMSIDSVKKELVRVGVDSGKTVAQLTSLSIQLGSITLTLDSATIRLDVSILIHAGVLSSSDSTALYPAYPVRVTSPVAVAGTLTAGGNAVDVTGSFSWTTGHNVKFSLRIGTATPGDSTNISTPTERFLPTDTTWSLNGNLRLQAGAAAAAGIDTLVIILSDTSGHSATSRATFQVVGRDTTAPALKILSPSSDTSVPNGTGTILVKAAATDSGSGLDSIAIGSMKFASSPCTTSVSLAVGVDTIKVQAWDKAGNKSTATVHVTRAKDTTSPVIVSGPVITWVAPSASLAVDATVSSYKVQVKATDLSGVDSVYLQGAMAKNDSGSYWSATLSLPSPNGVPMKVVVKAWDHLKNLSVDSTSITITRNAPSGTDKPALTLLQPVSSMGNTLTLAKDTLHVVYKITDVVPLDTTTILFGTKVPKRLTDSTWAADVPVPPTGQPFIISIQAGNTNKVTNTDEIVVTRAKDTVPPVPSLLSGLQKNMAVDYFTTSLKVGWIIADNYKMGTVLINKTVVAVTGTNGEYSTSLQNLAMGSTKVYLEAYDSTGNVAYDTLTVTRVLAASPVLTISPAVGTYDSILHVSIASSDSSASIYYTLDGTDPTPTNGLTYSLGGTILISQNRVLKVMATATGRNPSGISSQTYTLVPDAPVLSLPSGTAADSMFTVGLSSPTAGVTFYYTTDGSTPVVGVSPSTTSGILIDSIRTINVIASKSGWNSSAVINGSFKANIPIFVEVEPAGSKVIRADGSLWTTGYASSLADGSASDRSNFVKVKEGVRAVTNNFIVTTSGDLLSYGGAYGSTANSMNPIASGVVKVASSLDVTTPSAMYVDSKGGLWALGQNQSGQLCTGDSVDLVNPKLVQSGVKDVGVNCTDVRGGYWCGSVYVTSSGSAYACGSHVGISYSANGSLPTRIPGAGYSTVSAWADFFQGSWSVQFSLLTTTGNLSVPSDTSWVQVQTGVVKQILGGPFLYALEDYGWLYDQQIGSPPSSANWTSVSNLISNVSSNGATTLYIKTDGTLWASGTNGGMYGDGTTDDAPAMKRIHLPN